MNKGFVISMSTFLIASILVIFAVFYSGYAEKSEQNILNSFTIEKAGFVVDDVETDINKIIGTGIDINQGTTSAVIIFKDRLPGDMNKSQLLDLKEFIDTNYAGQQNSQITINVSELADWRTEAIFSNGLQYDYEYSDLGDNAVQFYMPAGDTSASRIDINVTINDSSVEVIPWTWQDITGDIEVTLNFTDENVSNAVSYSGKINSAIQNTYQWNYSTNPGDGFYIIVGDIDSNLSAVRIVESIDDSVSIAETSIKTELSAIEELSWYYNGDLNYSQSGVNINKKILEKRG